MLKILAFVLPLGLDSFAVAAAIGATGRSTLRQKWRISVLFVVFEAGMPLIGLVMGAPLAHVIGPIADYVAAATVVGMGAWMLLHGEQGEPERAERVATAHGAALIGLGISISMDELAIGFGMGLVRLPLIPVLIGIGVQAFAAAQLGLHLGARIAERFREAAECAAGMALIVLGLYLAVERLLSWPST